jgi:ribonuclease M5
MNRIKLKETVIVEGRYDRIRLSELIESPMIETGGFRVFKDKEKQELIRAVAKRRGILVMTDVDSAGFVIRNFLRGIVPQEQILHAYIPTIKGKEKRKQEASKEGILGVEGIDRDALIESIRNSGAHILNGHGEEQNATWQSQPIFEPPFPKGGGAERRRVDTSSEITKIDFFDYGLSGCANAAQHREEVLTSLGLPTYLTTNAMISALNCLFTKDEFEEYLSQL